MPDASSSLQGRERLAHDHAHGAAAAGVGARTEVGVGATVVAAAVVADGIQAGDRLAFGVDDLVVVVHHEAVERAEGEAAHLHAVVGGLVEGADAVRVLAELAVIALRRPRVVLLDLGEEEVHVEAHGLGDLLKGSAFTM